MNSKLRTEIRYVVGDATAPEGDGQKIIAHVCNDVGAWGAGFVLAMSKRWPVVKEEYKSFMASEDHPGRDEGRRGEVLGGVNCVNVSREIYVANMIAQHGVRYDKDGKPPIRYDALVSCLNRLTYLCGLLGASVHMPRIGCGLAGGDWRIVSAIIESTLCDQGIPTTVYDLPGAEWDGKTQASESKP